MGSTARHFLAAVFIAVVVASPAAAQFHPLFDVPTRPERAPTAAERDRSEALTLYGRSLLSEKNNRLIEAVHLLEQARALDPESTAILKAIIPLYLALDRPQDALTASQREVDLDPGDYETWYLYARQLRGQDRLKECAAALERGVACVGLKQHPELRLQMTFDLATLHDRLDDMVKAEAAFQQVADLLEDPAGALEDFALTRQDIEAQASEVYEKLGRICIRARRFDRADAYFAKAQTKAFAADPGHARRLSFNRAEALAAKGDAAAALPLVEEYLRTRPQATEAYQLKIDLLGKLDRGADVLTFLKEALALDSHNDSLQLLLARELGRAGNQAGAQEIYLEMLKTGPRPEVYRDLFTLWKGQRNGAERVLDHVNEKLGGNARENPDKEPEVDGALARSLLLALRDDPDLVERLLTAVGTRLSGQRRVGYQTRHLLAVLAMRTRQIDVAERLYRSLLEQGVSPAVEAEVYHGLLRVLWSAHKPEAVIEVCQQGLANAGQTINPVLFHVDLARAYSVLGRDNEAVASADKAVELANGDDKRFCRRMRANILAQAERYDKAVAECQAMLRDYVLAAEVHETRSTLSSIYSMSKDIPRAVEQLRFVLGDDPDDATAHNDLGYLLADNNQDLPEAEKLIRRALELESKQKATGKSLRGDEDGANAAFIDSLGWVLFRRGRLAEAEGELLKASKLDEGADDPVVWDHLGDVYQRQGETGKAAAAWKKAVELFEVVHSRKKDERYREVKHKLKLFEQRAEEH